MARSIKETARLILESLAGLPRKNPRTTGPGLLQLLKERTGDNTMQKYEVKDAFEVIKDSGEVKYNAAKSVLTRIYGFDYIEIAALGRSKLEEYSDNKIPQHWSPASNVAHNVFNVEGDFKGDVINTEGGDVYKSISINSFSELKEYIRNDDSLSDYGKDERLGHIDIIETELANEEPDVGIIKKAYEWLKRNTPRFIEGILIRLIPRVIMSQITPP